MDPYYVPYCIVSDNETRKPCRLKSRLDGSAGAAPRSPPARTLLL